MKGISLSFSELHAVFNMNFGRIIIYPLSIALGLLCKAFFNERVQIFQRLLILSKYR
jgi:hypothetical protein